MTRVNANCRVCGGALTVEIDSDYAEVGDIFNLLPMATHDHCYDLRDRRVRSVDRIKKGCQLLPFADLKQKEKLERGLSIALKAYARIVCDMLGAESLVVPVDDALSDLLERPHKVGAVLDGLRGAIRHAIGEQQEFSEAGFQTEAVRQTT